MKQGLISGVFPHLEMGRKRGPRRSEREAATSVSEANRAEWCPGSSGNKAFGGRCKHQHQHQILLKRSRKVRARYVFPCLVTKAYQSLTGVG